MITASRRPRWMRAVPSRRPRSMKMKSARRPSRGCGRARCGTRCASQSSKALRATSSTGTERSLCSLPNGTRSRGAVDAVVDEVVELEVEELADAQPGATQHDDGVPREPVVQFSDGGHQGLVDVGREGSGQGVGLAGDVGVEHERVWWRVGPSPRGDVVEEGAHGDCGVGVDVDTDGPVRVVAAAAGLVEVQARNASMWRRCRPATERSSGSWSQMNSPKIARALVSLSIVLGRNTVARMSR